jgi:hypothetical protein
VGRWYEAGRRGTFGEPTELDAREEALAGAEAGGRGVLWYRMLMSEGREDRMFAYNWDENTSEEQLLNMRANHVKQSLSRGDLPQIILASDQRIMGLTNDDMMMMGYVWDEDKEHWVHGEVIEEPQTYGAAAPYAGYGYGYPGYIYPQYAYPEYGGGSYSYPQSFVSREGAKYPQSFVQPGRRGVTPQQARNSPARFGAVTWRI